MDTICGVPAAGGTPWAGRASLISTTITGTVTSSPKFVLRIIGWPAYAGVVEYEEWLEFASIPELLDTVGQLIGPDLLMWGSALFGKPGDGGKQTPWHQDGEDWPIKPLTSVTVWLAIDEATTENGCL